MKQYIDKSAVVAEIEKRIKEHHSGYLVCLKDILSFLDTLEVKEEPISNELLISSELLTASADYARKQLANPDYPTYNDEYELLCAFEAGANWQKEQTINKACEFIETYPHLFMGVLRSEVIEDFKKYIEE